MEHQVPSDFVDKARANWQQLRPDLEVSSIEVMGRIGRISALASVRVERQLASAELSRAEFDVLCTLARSERPLRASEVTAATMLSGASTTKITERLVKRGLVERLPSERDGRVVLTQLTQAGTEMFNLEFPEFLRRDNDLLSGLTPTEQAKLGSLLRKVALRLESSS